MSGGPELMLRGVMWLWAVAQKCQAVLSEFLEMSGDLVRVIRGVQSHNKITQAHNYLHHTIKLRQLIIKLRQQSSAIEPP